MPSPTRDTIQAHNIITAQRRDIDHAKHAKYNAYSDRQPVAITIELAKSFVRYKNAWRRVYVSDDCRLYVWLEGREVWLTDSAVQRVYDFLAMGD